MAALQIPASIFARTLAPEVEMVCFLRRYSRRARFFPFRIIREDHALPNAVYETRVSKICGISFVASRSCSLTLAHTSPQNVRRRRASSGDERCDRIRLTIPHDTGRAY